LPQYRPEVVEAMKEAKKISKDTTVKSYTDLEEMIKELDN
jgi:DNA-damage-inducible protein J